MFTGFRIHHSYMYVGMRPDIYYKDDKVTFTFRLKAFICTICFMIVTTPRPTPSAYRGIL